MRSAIETVGIANFYTSGTVDGIVNPYSDEDYLEEGESTELEFRNQCKEYNRLPLIFRQEIKNTHEKCEGIGDVCFFSASAGCGIGESPSGQTYLPCNCEIEFNYCTQTTEGIGSEDKIERSFGGKN